MKKLAILFIAVVLVYEVVQEKGISIPGLSLWSSGADSALQDAYDNRRSDLQVRGEGVVTRILPDDLEGSRHQRFIVKLDTGQTLLISHNIDLAPRISGLSTGETVAFYGEYEWNSKGGVIHWTHHDPDNRHIAGWIGYGGRTYQ
jgi:hypothetical protein